MVDKSGQGQAYWSDFLFDLSKNHEKPGKNQEEALSVKLL